MLHVVNDLLSYKGLLLKTGTTVDATLINAPSSTKNASGQRDPEMHPTKKGNQWYFGMKAHSGVDADSGLVHSVITMPANVNDVTQPNALLHGEEVEADGDSGYQRADKRPDAHSDVRWHITMRPGKRRHQTSRSSKKPLLIRYRRSTHASVPRWSIRLGSSSSSLDLRRCATKDGPGTQGEWSRCSYWPTCGWLVES